MLLKNIPISSLTASKTNPRGKDFKGPGFDDLVASIKEKGVLVPILVRPLKLNGDKVVFEIIAGHRRSEAALVAGLEEIPASISEMDDVEAREAQIVENLQREDIHPLDEGEAYRMLIEKSKPRYEAKDIALKVGKSESYIRGRLALTNLCEKAAKAYRDGKIKDTQALLIARIDSEKLQKEAVRNVVEWGYETSRLRDWIEETVYTNLSNRPWAKDAKLTEMLGDSEKPSLFGDKSAGIDPVAHAERLAAFIEIKLREAKEKGEEMVKISTAWGTADTKGALPKDSYKILNSKKEIKDAKEVKKGIVVEGDNIGKIFTISTAKEDVKESSVYKKTPAEKAAIKKEKEASKKKKDKLEADFQEALMKIKLPLSKKHLDLLLEAALYRCGFSYQQPTANLIGAVIVKKSKKSWSDGKMRMESDYGESLKQYAEENGDTGKMRVIFALLMPHPTPDYSEDFIKISKKF